MEDLACCCSCNSRIWRLVQEAGAGGWWVQGHSVLHSKVKAQWYIKKPCNQTTPEENHDWLPGVCKVLWEDGALPSQLGQGGVIWAAKLSRFQFRRREVETEWQRDNSKKRDYPATLSDFWEEQGVHLLGTRVTIEQTIGLLRSSNVGERVRAGLRITP